MIENFVPGDSITIYRDGINVIHFKANAYGDYSLRERGDELCLCICINTKSILEERFENE